MGRTKKGGGSGLEGMKACYKAAKSSGDREEEAKWANQIGHAYKERGEYVEALTWLRLDYDISLKRKPVDGGPMINIMPSCQSLGEVYLRLEDFDEALVYQQRHLDLATEAKDVLEQQRASTQLGRTYMDMYEQRECPWALSRAKENLYMSLNLARSLKANPPPDKSSSSFLEELVDAINNLGMFKMLREEPQAACEVLLEGLQLCDEEEVGENDATRSRLHHNLGRLYGEQRQWELALRHTEKDISICRVLPHPQGEAKGLINLGQLHFKCQRYTEALQCYSNALRIAQKLQDEDHLASDAQTNIEVVQEAIEKMQVFKRAMEQHVSLQKKVDAAKGSASERSLYLQEFKALKDLLSKAFELQAYDQHLRLAKRLKNVVTFLGDMEKLGDTLGTIGEAYDHLRNHEKAKKWHHRSWQVSKRLEHLEAVAKINYANALDASGDWNGALQAFQDAYAIAKGSHLLSQELIALENIHYCYVVRLERLNKARKLEPELERLKQLKEEQLNKDGENSRCSETDSEAETDCAHPGSDENMQENEPFTPSSRSTLLERRNTRSNDKTLLGNKQQDYAATRPRAENGGSKATKSRTPLHRKRSRIVVSDEEESGDLLESESPRHLSKRKGRIKSATTAGEAPVQLGFLSATKRKAGSAGKRVPATLEAQTFTLSSDDDEPLVLLRNPTCIDSDVCAVFDSPPLSPIQNCMVTPSDRPPSGGQGLLHGTAVQQEAGKSSRPRSKIGVEDAALAADSNQGEALPLSSKSTKPLDPSNLGGSSGKVGILPGKCMDVMNPPDIPPVAKSDKLLQVMIFPHNKTGLHSLRTRAQHEISKASADVINSVDISNLKEDMALSHLTPAQRKRDNPLEFVTPRRGLEVVEGDVAEGNLGMSECGIFVEDSHIDIHQSTSTNHAAASSHNIGSLMELNFPEVPLIVPVSINNQTLRVILRKSDGSRSMRTIGWLMDEILQLYACDTSAGKKPVSLRLEFKGALLKPVQIATEVLHDITAEDKVEAIIQGWVPMPLVERYEANCAAGRSSINSALVTKLNNLKGSYEEVDASGCKLHDAAAQPLIAALHESDAVSVLDLSHNFLGNGTVHAIQEMIAATNHSDLGLTLDLHHNQLGAGSLMQICRCPVTLSRLEVLKLSGNRLTDAAARHLAVILAENKALATLEVEACGLTTRTIQQIGSSLQPGSALVKLSIGENNPIAGNAMALLLQKLSTLSSFTELDIRRVELDQKGVVAITTLLRTSSSISVMNMAGCDIQNHNAQVMCQGMDGPSLQLSKLDLSQCGFSLEPAVKLCAQVMATQGLAFLNLSNNDLNQQAAEVLALTLAKGGCRLKSLFLNNCKLGHSGVLTILSPLQGNSLLWELHMAGNFRPEPQESLLRAAALPQIDHRRPADSSNISYKQQQGHPLNHAGAASALSSELASVEDVDKRRCAVPVPKATVDNGAGSSMSHDKHSTANCDTATQNFEHESGRHGDKPLELKQSSLEVCDHNSSDRTCTQDNDRQDVFRGLQQNLESQPAEVISEVGTGVCTINANDIVSRLDDPTMQELVASILRAQGLRCLDLSDNGFTSKDLQQLSVAWGARLTGITSQQQITAHLFVPDGRRCSAYATCCSNH